MEPDHITKKKKTLNKTNPDDIKYELGKHTNIHIRKEIKTNLDRIRYNKKKAGKSHLEKSNQIMEEQEKKFRKQIQTYFRYTYHKCIVEGRENMSDSKDMFTFASTWTTQGHRLLLHFFRFPLPRL